MTAQSPPQVFISHAADDKNRFVLKFAEALRQNGVDAWLDKWEMLAGDSLVQRIFEEGIKDASAFIVVLSTTSVMKPWVRRELDAGVVKRVSGECRLIPVILDDCKIPECLRSTHWVRIKNLDDYDEEFKQIVNSIFGLSDKPPIGTAPSHSEMASLLSLPSLNKIDNMVLEALCEESVRTNDPLVTDLACLDSVAEAGATDDEIRDALIILNDEHYIELSHMAGPSYRNTNVSHLHIKTHAFDAFAQTKWSDYDAILKRLVSGIVNEGWECKNDFDQLDAPKRLGDHLLRLLEGRGHIQVIRYLGGYSIWDVSPKLRRVLTESCRP